MIEIREAKRADERQIFQLALQLATSFQPEAGAFSDQFEKVLSRDSEVSFVAEDGGRIVGYCLGSVHSAFYSNGPISWLEELFVLEAMRGFGIGVRLMNAFETWAAERGCALITLATRRAGEFYLKRGYERSADYYRKSLKDA